MEIQGMRGCCAVHTITGLGQCNDSPDNLSEAYLTERIGHYTSYAKNSHKAMITATTVKSQKNANKVLKELGWKSSKWCKRYEGSRGSNLIKMWWLPLGG